MSDFVEIVINLIVESKEGTLDFCISQNTLLEDIGMSSLEFIKFIVMVEEYYEIEVDDEVLVESYFVTVQDLAEYIQNKCTDE